MIEQRDTLERRLSGSRAFLVFVALLLSASLVGLIAGIRDDHAQPRLSIDRSIYSEDNSSDRPDVSPGAIPIASGYLQMNAVQRVRAQQRQAQRESEERKVTSYQAITYETPDELIRLRLLALDERDDRRAFNGAPPIVPHPVDNWEAQSCLVCHQDGRVMGELRATRMPHELLTNCAQCHASNAPKQLPWASERPLLAASSFEGAPAPEGGLRAYVGAPPTIPHALEMRNDCLSCHGPTGIPGIRTSHPERTSCFQCHALQSSALD